MGSLNVDRLWTVATLPGPGQTVLALETRTDFGGKGANQAVAARRQGAEVVLVGAVGADTEGQRYRTHLEQMGIGTSCVVVQELAATGAAHVYVDARGENQIVVGSGANAMLDQGLVADLLTGLLPTRAALLVQLESPLPAVREALRQAARHAVPALLNASPVNREFKWDIPIDTVIVNEHECVEFFGLAGLDWMALSVAERCDRLARLNIRNLIVTQGAEPTLHLCADSARSVPTYPVKPKDTVGAGDTFAGALAVMRAEAVEWDEAIWHANVAAALSTLSPGAQSAMPSREQVHHVRLASAGKARAQ